MEAFVYLAAVVVAGIVTIARSFGRRSRYKQILAERDAPIVLNPPRTHVETPWKRDPKVAEVAAEYGLRIGSDSFQYQAAEVDQNGRQIQAAIYYSRQSVVWKRPPPSLKQLAATSSDGFMELMRDMARFDDFPAPEGRGVATVREQLPPGANERERFQDLVDYVYCRVVGEEAATRHFVELTKTRNERGGRAAQRLMRFFPEVARAERLPQKYAAFHRMPEVALDAAAHCLPETKALADLAISGSIPGAVARRAWRRLAEQSTPDESLLRRALGAVTTEVFALAVEHAVKSGSVGEAELVKRADEVNKVGHATVVAGALEDFPSSEFDSTLAKWLDSSTAELSRAAARALTKRGSEAGSRVLVNLLDSPVDREVDFALEWLPALGAASDIGKIREFIDGPGSTRDHDRRADAAIEAILSRSNVAAGTLSIVEEQGGGLALSEVEGAVSFTDEEANG